MEHGPLQIAEESDHPREVIAGHVANGGAAYVGGGGRCMDVLGQTSISAALRPLRHRLDAHPNQSVTRNMSYDNLHGTSA